MVNPSLWNSSAVYWRHARSLSDLLDLIISSSEASAIAERLEELLMGQVPMPSRAACRQYATTTSTGIRSYRVRILLASKIAKDRMS